MASQLVVVSLWVAHDVGTCYISSIIKSATENLQGIGIHHGLFGTKAAHFVVVVENTNSLSTVDGELVSR